jgi:hypothetical protein
MKYEYCITPYKSYQTLNLCHIQKKGYHFIVRFVVNVGDTSNITLYSNCLP